jgi:hypothetical protein
MISVREQSTQLSNQILNQKIPLSSWLIPGIISSSGAMVGLALAKGFDSKVLTLINGAIGVASILASTQFASDKLLKVEEKIGLLLHLTKQCKIDSLSCLREQIQRVKRLEFQLKSFMTSLKDEQIEIFFILLGEHQIVDCEPSTDERCLEFRLSQKQFELLNRYSEIEKGNLKGFEIISKIKSAGEKKEIINKFLKLEGKQKILFHELTQSLEESNEEILYQLILSYDQYQLSSEAYNHLKTLNQIQKAFTYAAPISALLQILHRVTFQPMSVLFAIGSWGVVLMGAIAASTIFYHCFYTNQKQSIQAKALEIFELNKL